MAALVTLEIKNADKTLRNIKKAQELLAELEKVMNDIRWDNEMHVTIDGKNEEASENVKVNVYDVRKDEK